MKFYKADGINHKGLAKGFSRKYRLLAGNEIQPEDVENEHWLLRQDFPDATPEKILQLLIGKIIQLARGYSVLKFVDLGGDAEFYDAADNSADPLKKIIDLEASNEALSLLAEFRDSFPVLNFCWASEGNGKNLQTLSKRLAKRNAFVSDALAKELIVFEELKKGVVPTQEGLF